MEELKKYIRSVPDFPKAGINFYDITTLLQDGEGFNMAVGAMEKFVKSCTPDKVVAIESRGFFFGSAIVDRLGMGIIPVRKPGKLPFDTISEEYALEYGTDTLEIHSDTISSGDRVVIVDDLIATGGTLKATCNLIEKLGGEVVGVSALIGLPFLTYEKVLDGYNINCLITYDSE